ncbi:putative glycosyltransferase EpsJ [Rosistilla carotiformis]|uniref:Putative glycosyltransferase EpsJ n=1 Tax=Rosistilla carotiformis TaxID=2528017 RepID=A0A518JVH3_9BACT|nr:glycosyltransferase family 2 protein [Rosistilla carotiformis]QDV69537.1 putative glycosyltransferase EpsJ [Rosistilla carotiformis]
MFQISVITPVYNAAGMVRRAVESAIRIDEVGEVILIEDGSPDGAIHVCRQLESEFEKVRMLQHPGGENRGAGASRNLGIRHAQFPFIAFLDADDWYLDNRFDADKRILSQDPTIDGVYNALGNHYENESLRQMWLDQGRPEVLTLTGGVPTPEELPLVLLYAHPTIKGDFSTDTITVRREFFDRVGLFHTELRLQQDTHMWKRMSAFGRLAAGNLATPVVVRRVHANNRMTQVEEHHKYMELWWRDLGQCFRKGAVRSDIMQAYRRGYAKFRARRGERWKAVKAIGIWLLHEPSQLRKRYGFFDQTLREAFGASRTVDRVLSVKNRFIGTQ